MPAYEIQLMSRACVSGPHRNWQHLMSVTVTETSYLRHGSFVVTNDGMRGARVLRQGGGGRVRPGSSRYFIMKSISHENIAKSVAEGIWATQQHNEAKLNEAFRSVANVYLVFSVNSSGCFQVDLAQGIQRLSKSD